MGGGVNLICLVFVFVACINKSSSHPQFLQGLTPKVLVDFSWVRDATQLHHAILKQKKRSPVGTTGMRQR